ncbi:MULTISPECIES: FtsK/SpoIIIE domain-containing protein [Staphylococcus]|uniref:FtsK/SpoIIIE domain-containing protein n=1 Tax=Staphylococcus TaxID=1279 RepID=UPI00194F6AA2|nr:MULTISPECIES: FtsK/SpoIIIE domain-containing protein [Staphylococcus]MCT2552785.1 FtsK/SpoIIIE domain-containing protein [Staphylococcus aureus]MCT2556129.1 FtsK/SpoIIIE domain-containing protein [Staphylococcus aureus]MCT2567483.1 FtsK/SpoIIIE domain-containing protein [Staphylococcus aureus]MCT2571708.1 FtsK/SpoIIIE domain-containing protein [Staphylococcus aureus]MCT2574329.1 FtsK/SpoIIIE domain-containing protein [Staphylococcus aureus]
MAMNEIALFKGVRIQPYFKHIDFIFAGVFAFIFLSYRILMLWQGYISQQKALNVVEVYQYFKPHFLYLAIGTLVIFIIAKLSSQLILRFREKDLAEMIETQGFHNRTVIKKTTEYLDIDYKKTEYDYYPTLFYKRRRKTFVIHVKKDGSRFQDDYLELESIIEPMFNCELVEKRHIGRYLRYEFMPLKYKKRIVMEGTEAPETTYYDTKIYITHQILWDFVKAPHALITGVTGGGKTYFLFYMIRELFKRDAEVRLLDPKVSDLSFMKNVIGAEKVADTKGQIFKQLREANEEMEHRFRMMSESKQYQLGSNFRNFDLPPYFVIFDEVTAFTSTLDKKELQEMNDYLINIIMKGRQAGVFMFLTAQRPDADVIKGNVRDQLGLRVSMGNLSADGYRMTFGQTDKAFQPIHESDIGRGYISILGQYNEPILFDAPLMEQYDFVADVKQILNKE